MSPWSCVVKSRRTNLPKKVCDFAEISANQWITPADQSRSSALSQQDARINLAESKKIVQQLSTQFMAISVDNEAMN